MALQTIASKTRHHIYQVKRKAAELGLSRSRAAPPPKTKSDLAPAAKHRGPAFINADLEDVIGWLGANGFLVKDCERCGTYRIDFMDCMTPQQLVRFANDRRARRVQEALSPFLVDAGVGVPLPPGPNGRSLTGSSI